MIKIFQLSILFTCFILKAFSQKSDSTKAPIQFSGNITVTNNGVSLVPTFSLGKPAILIDMAIKGEKLSFEPMLNFATNKLKPWGFIFWLRYQIANQSKFKLRVGAHPSFVFSAKDELQNGVKKEVLTANRYVAAELVPSYAVSENTTISAYILAANQIGVRLFDPTFFLAVNSNSKWELSQKYFVRILPQFYFLKLANQTGVYSNASLILGKNNCPISLSTMFSKSIKTDIEINKFVWNVGLTYSF